MSDEQQDQIASDIADIKALVAPLPGRLTMLEEWRTEHQAWAERQTLEVSQRIERQTIEVLSRVTDTMQAMFNDAMSSKFGEDFEDRLDHKFEATLDRIQKKRRDEFRQEFKEAFGNVRNMVVWVQPILTLLLGVIALYAAFGR